ncbi:baseplate J/gp47 family protein [Streptomyces sp. NPDC091217]|uniref:baseplate J/gp47 family protein n=1 Tax=Streptomyces sp. NPDC091217 TaxID=3365975 RepID=UPI0037FE1814
MASDMATPVYGTSGGYDTSGGSGGSGGYETSGGSGDATLLRLAAVRADGRFNAFEGLEVDDGHPPQVPPQRTLLVRCLRPVPAGLDAGSLTVVGGVRGDRTLNPVPVVWALPASGLAAAQATGPDGPADLDGPADPDRVTAGDVAAFAALPDPDRLLVVRTGSSGDFSPYALVLADPQRYGFDPRLSRVPFTFKVDCPADLDPRPPRTLPAVPAPVPAADYLSRDYAGLRRLLLDRLSLLLPGWSDRSPADLGITVMEILAYLGDQLAYAQDAVATEAYLGTARRRVSVRRHARLLDYPMHDGAAARVWLALDADPGADGTAFPAGTEAGAADGGTDAVFRTLHPLTARIARNAVDLYAWGEERAWLPAGATGATLVGTPAGLGLTAGDVLVLQEVRGADGSAGTADPVRRRAVRLDADPVADTDPLTGTELVRVSWYRQDAPPFPLRLWRFPDGGSGTVGATVARANVVLAEHGTLVGPEPLVPAEVPVRGRYRPRLARPGLAHAVPYDHRQALGRPAAEALAVDPALALPALDALHDGTGPWTAVRDLLDAGPYAAQCVVETEDDGRAFLRFGDGDHGRAPVPGTAFTAAYRTGGGTAGNVGRDTLTRLSAPVTGVRVGNPLPAAGGTDPEPVEQVRQWAPQAFRVRQRAVTDADYAEVTGRLAQVRQTVAARRWTGSWYTETVTVERADGLPADRAFRAGTAAYLEDYRMAGGDVRVTAVVPVSLDIVLTVHIAPGQLGSDVRRDLLEVFSAGLRADGTPGFFHPANLAFGRPVYLSHVVAAASAVPGVLWTDTDDTPPSPNRFRRWGRPAAGERAAGLIAMGRQEVARCMNDPSRPEHGRIDFLTEGGA